jgi:hypothetical protein
VARFEVLSQNCPRGTVENHEQFRSRGPGSRMRFNCAASLTATFAPQLSLACGHDSPDKCTWCKYGS